MWLSKHMGGIQTYRGTSKCIRVSHEAGFATSLFILTDTLNQDCVENLFSINRDKGGKIPVYTYQDCSNQLILPKLPSPYDELSVYEFLQNKTYQHAGCLMYPTSAMVTFVDRLETLFSGIFEGVIHMTHVLA